MTFELEVMTAKGFSHRLITLWVWSEFGQSYELRVYGSSLLGLKVGSMIASLWS
jgi:hypothetical protein